MTSKGIVPWRASERGCRCDRRRDRWRRARSEGVLPPRIGRLLKQPIDPRGGRRDGVRGGERAGEAVGDLPMAADR